MLNTIDMRAGLLGERLGHSFSPQIHATLAGDRYTYELYERAPDQVGAFLKGNEWDALNVTIPYKKTVMPYLDEISDEARRIGAVNTITRTADGRLRGDNTDYFGFALTVRSMGVNLAGKKALVLGEGGASATAAAVLTDMGADVVVLSRHGNETHSYRHAARYHADAALIANCTPVGMYPHRNGQRLLDLARFPALECVLDMVYNPARTAMIQQAERLGIPAQNGLLMLVAQAKRACELFLGEPMSDSVITPIGDSIARQTENIILVGMPGCGKSTVATRLAEALGRPTVDTDRLIVDAAGTDIPTIFAAEGEDGFRLREIRAMREAGKMSSAVIATGGGAVTRDVNYPALHQNGRIVFLRRDLDKLPTDGRPISQVVAREELYAKRLPLYCRFADVEIDNNGDVDDTVSAILTALGYRDETAKG